MNMYIMNTYVMNTYVTSYNLENIYIYEQLGPNCDLSMMQTIITCLTKFAFRIS